MSFAKNNAALIVVDVQNGFCPNGNLAVPEGDLIIPTINKIAEKFNNVVLTQDWHPENHVSFANNHPNKQPFDSIELEYGTQVLWPSHCVQGTHDAALHADLKIDHAQLIIRKGFHQHIDSYSAFLEADQKTTTGLEAYLKQRGIDTVYIVGLATDFCVVWTAMDAIKLGFTACIIEDACKAIDLNGSLGQAWSLMQSTGVKRIKSNEIL